MSNEARFEKACEDIREGGYEYASVLYTCGFDDWEIDVTKRNVRECFVESAEHAGIWEDFFDSGESERIEYLEWLDWEMVTAHFREGIRRLIDEKFPDA